ncbi:MAG: response regulator [Bdellovibrio sp.]
MVLEKTKILIVDDRHENIIAMRELIKSDDILIYSALNADEALSLVLDNDFALALLDVQMPVVSGFDLARLIRGVNKTRHLPVIFVTAEQRDQAIIFEGYETGAIDLLFKPLDPYIVRSKIQAFVKLDRQSKLLREQVIELENLRKKAEEANFSKSQFLANMSHEIRTPLASVLGFSDVLSQGFLDEEERKECLSAIRRNGELLLRLIDDILDLSKIEAQQIQLVRSEFCLDEVLTDLETTLTLRAQQKGIELKIQRPSGRTWHFISDSMRIKQVFINVIGNAIKFTEKGAVEVSVNVQEDHKNTLSAKHATLQFRVKDSGIGISEEERQKLFKPFSQADASTRRRFGGTGLGLVISRHLAQSLGGDLKLVSSQPGEGSVFEIELQVEVVPSAEDKQPLDGAKGRSRDSESMEPLELQGKKILVVDDVSDNRLLISRYLKNTGVQIIEAASGSEALAAIEWAAPDLILMDIQMPMMDGYETTQRIRAKGYDKPIVALTAHAMKEEIERCREVGCDEVMTKPARRKELSYLIRDMMNTQ